MINNNFYKCGNCGFCNPNKKICMLKGQPVELTDYCSRHKQEVPTCERCGRMLTQPIIWNPEGDEVHIYCRSCFNSLF